MPKIEKFARCIYAGDPQDEYCQHCDGYHPVDDNGKAQEAPNCGGYEPYEPKQEQPVPVEPVSQCESAAESPVSTQADTKCVKGITNVIRAESGLSVEVNGRWYKFTFSEERILPEGCDIEAEKQSLWDSVNAEVDAQLDAVRN